MRKARHVKHLPTVESKPGGHPRPGGAAGRLEATSLTTQVRDSHRGQPNPPDRNAASAHLGLPVAVVDGPYDLAALSRILTRAPVSLGTVSCALDPSDACNHGTFIMGLLGARRDALIPGLCPDCRLLHLPLFIDENAPSAGVAELANAIRVAVAAGARLINLSLAILDDDLQNDPGLASALDYAEANGAVVLVAAGNQGRLAMGQLLSHPATIPVVAVDATHRLLPDSNFGPTISRRGVAALGHQVIGYAPGGGTTVMSGSSVATAVATGTLAQVWSACPDVAGAEILAAVARLAPRNGSIPPILDPDICLTVLDGTSTVAAASLVGDHARNYVILQGETTMVNGSGQPIPPTRGAASMSRPVVTPSHGVDGCACGAPGGFCTCDNNGLASQFVYVLGTVDIKFPDQSISEELQAVAKMLAHAKEDDTLMTAGDDETLRSWYYRVLNYPEARYVARQVCWILKVEGQPAYYLTLRDLHDLPGLIECLAHPDNDDLDLFVGSSSLIPTDSCPGIPAPVLLVEQLRSVDKDLIRQWCQISAEARSKLKKPAPNMPPASPPDPDRLFDILVQSADNLGDKDEWRALNYLAISCQPMYEKYADMTARGCDLDAIKVVPSRLFREKRIVDSVFAFRDKKTGVVQKYFVRVDVTHMYPMIVNQIAEYFDRQHP
jgi:hypothetical protein